MLLEVCLFLTFFLAGGIGKILRVRSLYVIGDGRCWIGRPSCELWTGCIRQRKGTSGKIWLFWFVRILNWGIGTGKVGKLLFMFLYFFNVCCIIRSGLVYQTGQKKLGAWMKHLSLWWLFIFYMYINLPKHSNVCLPNLICSHRIWRLNIFNQNERKYYLPCVAISVLSEITSQKSS